MKRTIRFAVLSTLLAIVVVGAGTWAFAQSSSQVYTGCLKENGKIEYVAVSTEPLKECKKDELQISWNQAGPQGPEGPVGPPGQAPVASSRSLWTSCRSCSCLIRSTDVLSRRSPKHLLHEEVLSRPTHSIPPCNLGPIVSTQFPTPPCSASGRSTTAPRLHLS